MTSADKVLVLVVALVMSCLGCSSEDAKFELSTDAKGKTYKLDKKTGEMWLVTSTGERSIEKSKPKVQEVRLPSSAVKQLDGKMVDCELDSFIQIQVYNGSDDWHVKSVVIRLGGGKRYKVDLGEIKEGQYVLYNAGPLSTGYGLAHVGHKIHDQSFAIESATGLKSTPQLTAQDPSRDVSRY